MAQLLIRGLDEKAVECLKQRARQSGRSLESEARVILEQVSKVDMATARMLAEKIAQKHKGRKSTDSAILIREGREE
jgi:plasmid stability protein